MELLYHTISGKGAGKNCRWRGNRYLRHGIRGRTLWRRGGGLSETSFAAMSVCRSTGQGDWVAVSEKVAALCRDG